MFADQTAMTMTIIIHQDNKILELKACYEGKLCIS